MSISSREKKINPQKTISSAKDIRKVDILNKENYDRIQWSTEILNFLLYALMLFSVPRMVNVFLDVRYSLKV